MNFSLKQIRHFLAAAEAGQISRAAVDFNISQSALTASIQQLETSLGMQLFERHPGGVTLTNAGARFAPYANTIASACNDALRMSREVPHDVQGQVSLAVTYTVAGYFLTPILMRFRRLFPQIEIVLREAERVRIEEDILNGSGEVGLILTSNLANADQLESVTLFRSTRRLWAPSDHPLLQRETVGLADIAAYPYVALTVDEALQTAMRYWRVTASRPNVLFSTASVEAVRTMVAAGLGITVLSDMVYRPWSLEGQRIETRDITDLVPTMDVGLTWNRRMGLGPAAQAFVDYLQGAAQRPQLVGSVA